MICKLFDLGGGDCWTWAACHCGVVCLHRCVVTWVPDLVAFAVAQFLEGFVTRACLLAVLLIMHTWHMKGAKEKWTEQASQVAANKAFKLMLKR